MYKVRKTTIDVITKKRKASTTTTINPLTNPKEELLGLLVILPTIQPLINILKIIPIM
jgi:hypothetical protein